MSSNSPMKKPMFIEGYQVFAEAEGQPGSVAIKQEPIDPELQVPSKSPIKNGVPTVASTSSAEGIEQNSQKIRELLKQMVEDRGKELTVKNVVEDLLQKNEFILAQSDVQSVKPHHRTLRPKPASDKSTESHGSILQPKDPTATCTKEDISDINEALVETAVNESSDSNCDPDLVCAVGSKIMLMTPLGKPFQMDITCYWCNFCSYRSDKKDTLLQHVMEHRFHCKYCKYQSFSRASVIHHCTEEHESFTETASTLKYCTYLPDFLQRSEQKKKRKKSDSDNDVPSSKKARNGGGDQEQLNMEVDEVDNRPSANTSVQRVITPRKATARKSLPAASKIVPPQFAHLISPNASPSQNDGLPVITNVVSGQLAVSAVTGSQPPAIVAESPKAPSVTVSSGLCWNCGYCGFVTLSQAFLKIHLNANHPGKAHKYVAMLVSSEEEMEKIKASDSQLIANPSGGGVIVTPPVVPAQAKAMSPLPPARTKLPAPVPKASGSMTSSQIEIDNAEHDSSKDKAETEEEKKIPVSFKCAHCNFSSPQAEKVKTHLFQRHNGSVMYALDMKAVKLRQKRYVFFCMKTKCSFQTKEIEDYLEHCDSCTPWLDGKDRKDVDSLMIKSLDLTRQFIVKTAGSTGTNKDIRSEKAAEYGCVYCSYISNNNTRLKKHVLSNHAEKSCLIRDLQANKTNRKPSVYFCHQCLWETREGSELEMHLKERHNETSKQSNDKAEAAEISTEKVTETRKSPSPSTTDTVMPKAIGNETTSTAKETSSESVSDDEREEQDYSGIVDDAEFEKAMKVYITSEEIDSKRNRGRPSRNAALKCQIKVKSVKPPPLYKCMHCSEIHFGVKLMRNHLRDKHNNQPLRALDILKHEKHHTTPHFCFCPVEKCIFAASMATDVVNHAKNSHGMKATDNDLVRISNSFITQPLSSPENRGRPATAATGESYECLYCSTSKLYHSRRDMKKHLKEQHLDEEFIYRDCIARKLRQPSRFYMCHNVACDYTTEKVKDYSLHLLGHKKAKIFECSKCQWFTSNSEEVDAHLSNVHKGEKITSLEIDLDLDSRGNLIKLVGGTVIKSER